MNNRNLNPQVFKELGKRERQKKIKALIENVQYLKEGSKVKINVSKLQAEKSYQKRNKNWRQFIESNQETIFTVEYEPGKGEKPYMVVLREDPTPIKWLFFTGDLVKIIMEKEIIENQGENYED